MESSSLPPQISLLLASHGKLHLESSTWGPFTVAPQKQMP